MKFEARIVMIYGQTFFCWVMHAHMSSLKQPEYQHHRESIGAAKTLDQIEDITAQLKSSLLVWPVVLVKVILCIPVINVKVNVHVHVQPLGITPVWACRHLTRMFELFFFKS